MGAGFGSGAALHASTVAESEARAVREFMGRGAAPPFTLPPWLKVVLALVQFLKEAFGGAALHASTVAERS